MWSVTAAVGAPALWDDGITGAGIDVAVVDTGIAPVSALSGRGKLVDGPDLSFDLGIAELEHLDGFGHGTHMAGIIAGRSGDGRVSSRAAPDRFLGVAPDARLVNVKVGDNTGAVDVSQVIAGLDWIVEHRRDQGLDIRVINLSFGTDGVQPYLLDPLAKAVERAWSAGIVVVVAAGNDGRAATGLATPATDPFVITVGAVERTATGWASPSFASNGNGVRNPDLVAPGRSIASLRVPGSRIDVEHPSGYVSPTLFRGSGSSQATAVVSGAVALLLQQRPSLTPDQVKRLLTSTADRLPGVPATKQGSGLLDLAEARRARTPSGLATWQPHLPSTGLGLLQLSRGLDQVAIGGKLLTGELTVLGTTFDPALWVALGRSGATWSGGSWSGGSWSGGSWSGGSWSGGSWSGGSWSGGSWSGGSWSGGSWSGGSWSGGSWSGGSWSGGSWSGGSWSGAGWT